MAATIAEVVTRARELLQDTVTPYRFSDARVIGVLNAGFREARRLRPDIFLVVSFVTPEFTEAAATDSTLFPLDDQFMNVFINFIVGFTELSDDEFAVDGRANTLLITFRNQLVGGVA